MMKKITFKVTIKKEGNLVSLIKNVNKFSSRIRIDLEHGIVTDENLEDNMIDSIMELINHYFEISSIDIDNVSDKSTSIDTSQSDVVANESETDSKTEIEAENPAELENKTIEVASQSKDDLIIKKVEFENEYIENLLNSFMKTAYWTMYKMNISEQ